MMLCLRSLIIVIHVIYWHGKAKYEIMMALLNFFGKLRKMFHCAVSNSMRKCLLGTRE